jgi:hypothetical protein
LWQNGFHVRFFVFVSQMISEVPIKLKSFLSPPTLLHDHDGKLQKATTCANCSKAESGEVKLKACAA